MSFNPGIITFNALSDGRYQMLSGSQVMFVFPDMLEAGNALSATKKYGFTFSCFVGRPGASLQYMRAGATGTFDLSPGDATVAVHERLKYAFTWTVPEALNWHDLQSLHLPIRDDAGSIFWVVFDEASKTFSFFDEATGKFTKGLAPGNPKRIQTLEATLYLAESSVVGSGPAGPSVTLNLSLGFKPRVAGHTFLVEVAATDDLGNEDDFAEAGLLKIEPIE